MIWKLLLKAIWLHWFDVTYGLDVTTKESKVLAKSLYECTPTKYMVVYLGNIHYCLFGVRVDSTDRTTKKRTKRRINNNPPITATEHTDSPTRSKWGRSNETLTTPTTPTNTRNTDAYLNLVFPVMIRTQKDLHVFIFLREVCPSPEDGFL